MSRARTGLTLVLPAALAASMIAAQAPPERADIILRGGRVITLDAADRVAEAPDGTAITAYNQDPATLGRIDRLITNIPEFYENYHGVEISARKRLSNRWQMLAGYTVGRHKGISSRGSRRTRTIPTTSSTSATGFMARTGRTSSSSREATSCRWTSCSAATTATTPVSPP